MPGHNNNHGNSAQQKGSRRKRRRHRAERREATREVREKINEQRRAEGHPGWVHSRAIYQPRRPWYDPDGKEEAQWIEEFLADQDGEFTITLQ